MDVICRMYYRDRFKAAKSITEKLSCYATYIKLDFRNRHNWKSPLDFVEFSEMLHKRCPHLQTLILRHAHLSGTLQNAVDLCTQFLQNIKVLVFHYSIFANCPTEEKYDCISKIEVLDICGCVLGDFNRPPFSRMPNLKKLYLAHTGANSSWFQDPSFLKQLEVLDLSRTEKIFPHTFQIIKDHGLQLKELYMCSSYLHDRHLNFNNSVFPSLETISLKFNYCVTCEGVISLIQSCPSLCQVFVCVIVAESFAVHPFVVANKCKFENVQVISSGYKKKSYLYA